MPPKKQKGKGIKETLKKAHELLKKSKVLSTAANNLGYTNAGEAASAMGYGRRKRRQRGSGFMDFIRKFAQVPGNILAGTAMGLNSGIGNLGGRRRRRPRQSGGFMMPPMHDYTGRVPGTIMW